MNVSALADLFPQLEELGIGAYWSQAAEDGASCEFFQYRRGTFMSSPKSGDCQIVDADGRRPNETDSPLQFDRQALDDLASMKALFARAGMAVQYLNLSLDEGRVGRGSVYSPEGCVSYVFDPGWTVLPDVGSGAVAVGIDARWYKIDSCI